MPSLLAQAAAHRPVQLAVTAVVSGAVVAAVLLGCQERVYAARLQRLKGSISPDPADRNSNGDERADAVEPVEEALDAEERRALALARRAQAGDYAEEVILEQLTRNRAFLTPAGLDRVRQAVVVVVGCGGVGSHAAAALARSGVGRIRLVDFDQVSLSSLNRHAVATLADVGRPKVRVLARRLQAVAPWVRFDLRGVKFDEAAADRLLESWDETPLSFVVDAIDNIDTKVALLRYCHERGLPVISAMGAATKSDPTKVVVGDLAASAEDRLSRAVRRRLKLAGITHGIPAVFSTEPAGDGKAALLPLPEAQYAQGRAAVRELGALPDFRVRILPVLGTMPAVFGCTVANHILLALSGYPHEYAALKGRDKLYDQVLAALHGQEEKLIRARDPSTSTNSATALGLRLPLTAGDVAFLLEEVYRGRSAVSGLPTRTALVRWQLPPGDDRAAPDALFDRLPSASASDQEQRAARLRLSDLVCMTREEAARHHDQVLLRGTPVADLYDAATLARIDARRKEAAAYEEWRC